MIEYDNTPWGIGKSVPQEFINTFNHFQNNVYREAHYIWAENNERNFILWLIAKAASDLPGDFVECGVFNGISAYYMATNCKTKIHLFDSWEGAQDFTEFDNPFYKEMPFKIDMASAELMLSDFDNTIFHRGPVPFEFDQVDDISLLHIDMDVYIPTKIALEQLWDKVAPGGIVVVDFHDGIASGAEKATRDFFENKEINVLPTGKAIIVK
jgi:hypothetical protein